MFKPSLSRVVLCSILFTCERFETILAVVIFNKPFMLSMNAHTSVSNLINVESCFPNSLTALAVKEVRTTLKLNWDGYQRQSICHSKHLMLSSTVAAIPCSIRYILGSICLRFFCFVTVGMIFRRSVICVCICLIFSHSSFPCSFSLMDASVPILTVVLWLMVYSRD